MGRAGALLASLLAGCEVGDVAFVCTQDGQCDVAGGGVCEKNGSCSFPDDACDSGRRFSERSAGAVAGECLECGGPGQPCCGPEASCGAGLECAGSRCGCVAMVEAGGGHTCASKINGGAVCWGRNERGQLGNGLANERSEGPVDVGGIAGVVAIAAGTDHSCAIATGVEGAVECWGSNDGLAIGGPENVTMAPEPHPVPGTEQSKATRITAGDAHTCAMGRVDIACWGSNDVGQLGSDFEGQTEAPTPVGVSSDDELADVTAGERHTCALSKLGVVHCWGSNTSGQLGDGSRVEQSSSPLRVHGITDATAISAGGDHTCAIVGEGSIVCWGSSSSGESGRADVTEVRSPSAVALPSETQTAVGLAAGGSHTCAILDPGGSAWCWGDNSKLQLGDDSLGGSPEPVQVAGLEGARSLSAGAAHTCALLGDGSVRCWGANGDGQLGIAPTRDPRPPTEVVIACP